MFDLTNLSDYEFELLCRDIMADRLGLELHTFPKGPDGGVDLCDAQHNPNVVIQAKHYKKSGPAKLLAELEKELAKVRALAPRHYYVCTSVGLTRTKKDEIAGLFGEWMQDRSHVVDAVEINAFLARESSREIVNRHYKLWFCASSVLALMNNREVFIDCDALIEEIQEELPLFVQTNAFFAGRDKLRESHVILLAGAPGVGKSTVSKMLLLHFAREEGHAVRYTTDNDIAAIKRTLSADPAKKEIILLDDFLGQHYLKLRDSQPNQLKALIAFVERSPSKKLILNSRITILNEAAQSSPQFHKLLAGQRRNEYLIDLDAMSGFEKAQILYNHLYFCNLPAPYFSCLKRDRRYRKIIGHKNYNPRIIEYVTMESSWREVEPADYFNFVMGRLEHPEDVWRDEFRNRLEEPDRILMNTLYSLTDTRVEQGALERAFHRRIRDTGLPTTLNLFEDVIKRLGGSLIRLLSRGETVEVQVINPSVNDYLMRELEGNPNEQLRIMESAVYAEQLFKAARSQEAKHCLAQRVKNLPEMDCLHNDAHFYTLKAVVDCEVWDTHLVGQVREAFAHLGERKNEIRYHFYLIRRMINSTFVHFYNLHEILMNSNMMSEILVRLEVDQLMDLVEEYQELWSCEEYNTDQCFEIMSLLKRYLIICVSAEVDVWTDEQLFEIALDNVEQFSAGKHIDYTGFEGMLKNEAQHLVRKRILNEIEKLSERIELCLSDFDLPSILRGIDYDTTIDGAYEYVMDSKKEDSAYAARKQRERDEAEAIASLFER